MDPVKRLAELGIELPDVPKPVASYVPAVRSENTIYVSGQLPFVDGELAATGIVGRDLDTKEANELARLCAINMLAALQAKVGDLRNVTRVVRLEGFVACEAGYGEQPQVINGASELIAEVFGEAGKHARIAVGVSALPLNAPVEVSGIFQSAPPKI